MIYGIDYASYQGMPNFGRLRSEGHEFAISKVTGEGSYVNPYWEVNRSNARTAGLVVGTYDWVEPQGQQSGAEAAADYLRYLGDRMPGELLCVDFETPQWADGPLGRGIESWMRAYLYTLRDQGRQPVIVYTAPYFLQETGAMEWQWLGQDFLYWIAAPGPGGMSPDDGAWPSGTNLLRPWKSAVLHQHQWHATSGAIAGEFDRNRFQGTRAELMTLGLQPSGTDVRTESYIDNYGEPVTVVHWGGQATKVLGTSYQDLGIRVENAVGATYHRSIRAGVAEPYVKE